MCCPAHWRGLPRQAQGRDLSEAGSLRAQPRALLDAQTQVVRYKKATDAPQRDIQWPSVLCVEMEVHGLQFRYFKRFCPQVAQANIRNRLICRSPRLQAGGWI